MTMQLISGNNEPSARARVRLEVGNRVFVGDLQISDAAFKGRVSDVVNDPAVRFLALVDVECLNGHTGGVVARAPFMLVRVEAIDVLMPLREPSVQPLAP